MSSIFRPVDLTDAVRRPRASEVSLAQLNTSGTAVSWDEAVAITQQTARALLDYQGTPIVNPAGLYIQESGELVLRLSGSADPKASLRSVGELLRNLVAETSSPAPLNALIANATTMPPTYGSLAELSQALGRYERPNGRQLIQRVYERWVAQPSTAVHSGIADSTAITQAHASTSAWVARFKRVSGARESVQVTPSTAYLRTLERRRRLTRNIYLVGFATVLAVAILSSEWRIATAIRGAVSTLAHVTAVRAWRAGPTLTSVVDNGVGWVRAPFSRTIRVPSSSAVSSRSTVTATDNLPPVRATGEASRQPQIAGGANRGRGAPSALIGTQTAPLGVAPQQNALAPSPEPNSVFSFQAALSADPSDRPAGTPQNSSDAIQVEGTAAPPEQGIFGAVYTQANAEVAPPTPLDPQVLDAPPAGSQHFVAFDIVVDENGRVETARLVTRPTSMRDAMQATGNLSAAKTWRFRPARKDGQPVKYRSRVWLVARD